MGSINEIIKDILNIIATGWFRGGAQVVRSWCRAQLVPRRCPGGAQAVSRWCAGGAQVVRRWCPNGAHGHHYYTLVLIRHSIRNKCLRINCNIMVIATGLCPDCAQVVPKWCPGGVQVVPKWCPGGAQVVPRWCPGGAHVPGGLPPGGVIHLHLAFWSEMSTQSPKLVKIKFS